MNINYLECVDDHLRVTFFYITYINLLFSFYFIIEKLLVKIITNKSLNIFNLYKIKTLFFQCDIVIAKHKMSKNR